MTNTLTSPYDQGIETRSRPRRLLLVLAMLARAVRR